MRDFHIHTIYSDGTDSIAEMLNAAVDSGVSEVAITDHVWSSSAWFDEYCREINTLKDDYDIKINIGFEAKALSLAGNIDASQEMLQESDIRMAAIHRIPSSQENGRYWQRKEIVLRKQSAYKDWMTTSLNIIIKAEVDILAHPFAVMEKYDMPVPPHQDVLKLFSEAEKNNVKLEISGRYRASNQVILNFLSKNPKFINTTIFGSDAHSAEELHKTHTPLI